MDNNITEAPQKKRGRRLLIIFGSVFGGLLVVFAACLALVLYCSRPITVEAGEDFGIPQIEESKLLSAVCSIPDDAIDTGKCGEQRLTVTIFGFVKRDISVFVKDTVSPTVETLNVIAPMGTELKATDFIKSVTDLFNTDVAFNGAPPDTDTVGEYKVELKITDSSGNSTVTSGNLEVTGKAAEVHIELGENDPLGVVKAHFPDDSDFDISNIDPSKIGSYTAYSRTESYIHIFTVSVGDTTPPTAVAQNILIRKGETVSAEMLVKDISDRTKVSVRFDGDADFTKPGIQNVAVVLEDAAGNTATITAKVEICDIPDKITLQSGFTSAELDAALFGPKGSAFYSLTVVNRSDILKLKSGECDVKLKGDMGELTVKLTVKDTTPPVLTLKSISVAPGAQISPSDFVVSCKDASAVTYSFKSIPNTKVSGNATVTVIATDSFGNSTSKTATLHVTKDTVPPVIYGVTDLSIVSPENISYVRGVYAVDAVDGEVRVIVDSSAVNIDINGVYPVKYTAVDNSGNKAEITVKVTVNIITVKDTATAAADAVLDVIINDSMTQREKAWAIYSWSSKNIRYSNATSYLMGQFYEGAASGFSVRYGNCYIYYSVTSLLLTRAGIENIEIQRDDPARPHYWNLVKIDGKWYHLDTCPHYAGHKKTVFLWTDAQVAEYSRDEVEDYYSFNPSLYPKTP